MGADRARWRGGQHRRNRRAGRADARGRPQAGASRARRLRFQRAERARAALRARARWARGQGVDPLAVGPAAGAHQPRAAAPPRDPGARAVSATAATTAASREERHGQAPPKKSFASKITAKHLFSSLITFLLVIGEVQFKILGGYDRLALALGTCMLT